ncbi:MAG: hypothetical protein U9R42_04680 [Bacteroidota bacterium]|nr:hypothetical protein [Bacteroidota bacterium]
MTRNKTLLKHFFTFILIFSFSIISNADGTKPTKSKRKRYKEITKTDITKYKDISSSEIMIFGIHLNMKINEVKTEINKNKNIFLQEDPFNSRRFYLYEKNSTQAPLCYLKWDDNNDKSGLQEVVFYFKFIKYLPGISKNLLTLEVINKNSEIVKTFMGYPTRKELSLQIPSLGIKTYSYYYPERNFKINRYISDNGSSISFCIFAFE